MSDELQLDEMDCLLCLLAGHEEVSHPSSCVGKAFRGFPLVTAPCLGATPPRPIYICRRNPDLLHLGEFVSPLWA